MSKLMSVITSSSSSSSSSSISSSSSDQNSKLATCGDCGKELDKGWNCPTCRIQCPICNRSIVNNQNEYCERCFKLCEKHGLYSIKIDGCIQCTYMKQ